MENVEIKIRPLQPEDHQKDQVTFLCDLINTVYAVAEEGMWKPGTERVSIDIVQTLIAQNAFLLAEINKKIVGCVHISLFDSIIAEFGILVADPHFRGIGIGRELIKAAEEWALENKRTVMRLELLTPKSWKQPSKEFLKSWYTRMGYRAQYKESLEKKFPEKVNQLATECVFTIYDKKLC